MVQTREVPIRVKALDDNPEKSATFIFLHGLGDDAGGWVNIAQQFQSAQKLPYLNWIFPNACFNQEASTNAWYTPTAFSPIPVGRSSSGNASDSEHREDHNEATQLEILESAEYICTLVDQEIENGIDVERIVIGGFSQGCAVALITGLGSRYAGKIGGIVGLSGYLPDGKVIENAMKSTEGDGKMKLFLAHGARDMLVPMRIFRASKKRLEEILGEENLDTPTYEGMGHTSCGAELRDLCSFLEKVVPA
ncbi:alpha/beta-Hydrolase [Glarea lozoyensis ATCC 20868]|uniref:Acyl-protein thioesterase 1 n=1 Tax=Glarea lozoyensis (strain ATCC 20868 / MF5171) TaxID=1116229 RepID=S3CGZ9_GLAL2|nr:alpha/beta-Hydrolase [Glarea lozoyensis ATCC 20868]EPE25155.1 alpha/beta-Hydrolase [Glarea lozoyensis ATCC 20868]